MKQLTAIVIGAGGRGRGYTNIMLKYPEKFKVVGVAEPIEERRNFIIEKHGVDVNNAYDTWETILDRPKFADVAIICTMDRMHKGPALKAIELGYDLLLEKPVAPTPEDCAEILLAARKKGVKIMVCHVLRYTSAFRALKHYIKSGVVGEVVSVNHIESVGYAHQSHSFVRGNWGNSQESTPMLLQKSCHDIDILQWLLDKECKKVQSFGSLRHFVKENAPSDAPERCADGCPHKDECLYHTDRIYKSNLPGFWFKCHVANSATPTEEELDEALKTTQYGKCVYKCNNDVVDHQVVNMEFEDGLTVSFTMTAFANFGRQIRVMGTKGELWANVEHSEANLFDYATGKTTQLPLNESGVDSSIAGGHGGGDTGIVGVLYEYVNGNIEMEEVSEIEISCKNHMIVFAAEEARHTGTVVDVEKYYKKYIG